MITRIKKCLFYSVILFYVFICSFFDLQAQVTDNEKTLDKVNIAAQIPEENLANMPTEELIQAYLKSRYPWYILIYDGLHKSFKKSYNNFNGLRELLNRQDAAKKIFEFYKKMDTEAYDPNWPQTKQGTFSFSFVFIEILLSQENILSKLTQSDTKIVLAELIKKNELRAIHPEIFSNYGIECNTYAIAKLLISKGNDDNISQTLLQTPNVKFLLETGKLINANVHSIVIKNAKEYLDKN